MKTQFDSNIEEEILDENLEKIVSVLHDIPQEPLSDDFDKRLSIAFKEEGLRIRGGRNKSLLTGRRLRTTLALAACLLVVFVSTTVYNDDTDQSSLERAAVSPAVDCTEDVMVESGNDGSASVKERHSDASKGLEPKDFEEMDSYDSGMISMALDTDVERLDYLSLIDDKLKGYDYELIGWEKDVEADSYVFNVMIIADPAGKIMNDSVTFEGKLGEIHETDTE
jgi:hypothetical protein